MNLAASDRASARALAALFRSSPVGIGCSRLRDGVIVDFNDALLEITGYAREEVVGRSSAELRIWGCPQERAEAFARIAAGEPIHEQQISLRRKDGSMRQVRFSATSVELDGELHLLGHLRDVTEELALAREREIAEHRLQVSLAIVPVAVFHQDRDLRYTYLANPHPGWSAEALLGRHDRELLAAADAAKLTAIKQRALDEGRSQRQQLEITYAGESHWFDLLVEPEADAAGNIVGIICAAADITAHRRREELYRAVLEDQTELIGRYLPDGTMVYANPVYCRFFGRSEAETVGSTWHPVAYPDDVAMVETQIASLAPENPVVTVVNRVFRADGAVRWMEFVNRALFDADGRLREIQSVGRDITARKEVEAELAASRIRLKELYVTGENLREIQRKEIAGEIHDQLGAAFTAVSFRLDALKHRLGDAPPLVAELDLIRVLVGEANAAARMICNRLRPPLLDDLGLVAACRWYLEDWSRLVGITARGRFTRLAVEPPEPLRTGLFRAFQELLTNVARHSGATAVRVSLGQPRDGLRLRVTDNGRGCDPAIPVAGFGLAGIRERVNRHGGSLTLLSRPGETIAAIRVPPGAGQ